MSNCKHECDECHNECEKESCGGCHGGCGGQEAVLEADATATNCPDCNNKLQSVKLLLSGKIVGLACDKCGFVFDPSTMDKVGRLF
jgi:hypothetical protein